jgi:type I restriction enzyme M protein
MTNSREKVNFFWSVIDLLRGAYEQANYGKVIRPMTMLLRLDSVLGPTKEKVVQTAEKMKGDPVPCS